MKYKSLNQGYDFLYNEDLLETLLLNRGVEDPKRLLNLNSSEVHDGMFLKNMDKGLTLLKKHCKSNSKIHILVDCDADGLTSGAMIYLYIKDIKPEIQMSYSINTGKQHGIVLKELKQYNFDLLITPDSGSNDIEECNELSKQGIDILVLDHHDIERDNKHATVVNCKDGQYPNTTLAGAGVVYKFCKEYDKKYNFDYADKYLDLLAVGCVADVVDLRDYETRFLTLKGIENFGNNDFLRELALKQDYSLQGKVTIKGIGWYVAPLLNAVIRVGEQEDKINIFRALIGEQETIEYQPRRKKRTDPKPPVEHQTLQQAMARICCNLKGRQSTLVKKNLEMLEEKINREGLAKNKILIIECGKEIDKNFTGLIANQLASRYKRPVILLKENSTNKKVYGGSCRNYSLFPIDNFKDFLEELNIFNMLAGHGNAFGLELDKDKVEEVKKRSNELLKDVKIKDVYKVDYEVPIGRLKLKHVRQVGKWQDLWGNQLDEPLFAITDIYIPTNQIKLLGQNKNFIKFEAQNIPFIMKFAGEDVYNKMICRKKRGLGKNVDRVKIDVVGTFTINKWAGKEYPQIEIVDFNSVEGGRMLF